MSAGTTLRLVSQGRRDAPALIVGSTVLTCLLVVTNAPTPIRSPVVLLFFCVVPGLALVRLLDIGSPVAAAALGAGLSLALTGTVAGVLVYVHLWSPEAVLLVVAAVAVAAALKGIESADGAGASTTPAPASPRAAPVHDAEPFAALRRLVIPRTTKQVRPELWLLDDLDLRPRGQHLRSDGTSVDTPHRLRGVRVTALSEDTRVLLDWRLLGDVPDAGPRAWRCSLAVEALDRLADWGCEPAIVSSGAAYGASAAFRTALEARGLRYLVRLDTVAAFDRLAAKDDPRRRLTPLAKRRELAAYLHERNVVPEPFSPPHPAARPTRSRFAVLSLERRVLLLEWPAAEEHPIRFWLSNLPQETSVARLATLATLPQRNRRPRSTWEQDSGLSSELKLTVDALTQQFHALRTHRVEDA